jgi:hypothetical protein
VQSHELPVLEFRKREHSYPPKTGCVWRDLGVEDEPTPMTQGERANALQGRPRMRSITSYGALAV